MPRRSPSKPHTPAQRIVLRRMDRRCPIGRSGFGLLGDAKVESNREKRAHQRERDENDSDRELPEPCIVARPDDQMCKERDAECNHVGRRVDPEVPVLEPQEQKPIETGKVVRVSAGGPANPRRLDNVP